MSGEYGVAQVQTLENIEAIRRRPGMYIGSVSQEGVQQIALEIISNAVDEFLNGECTECKINVSNDNTISVFDNGRGVPFGKKSDGTETLENIFTKIHTGAKFDADGKTGYNTSGGMNGVGAKATNALSERFSAISIREGKVAEINFKRGIKKSFSVHPLEKSAIVKRGTLITFLPDEEIFKDGIELDYDLLKKQLTELAYLSPGLKFTFKYKDKEEEIIFSKNGLSDYVDYLNGKNDKLTGTFYAEAIEDRVGVKVAVLYSNTYSENYRLYTNSIPNSDGTHVTGFRAAFTATINEYARDKGLLKEKDSNLSGDDLKEGRIFVLSLVMPDPVFSGQTKDELTSTEARGVVQRLVSRELRVWLDAHSTDAKSIVNKALLARKARENARKAREHVRNVSAKNSFGGVLPGTLSDCNSSDRKKCEVFIVEGIR